MIRAVLDTNVVISGIFWKGAPFEILVAWQSRRFGLVISEEILDEYRRVGEEIARKRGGATVAALLRLIERESEIVEPVSLGAAVCSDPDDDKFLATALAGHAKYVVSGDAALLRVKNYKSIEIIRAAQFLGFLEE